MPSRIPRITNGQRAAVCGLMIAGICFSHACKIADVSRAAIKEYLPRDWEKRKSLRKKRSYRGGLLEAIRKAYGDRSLSCAEVAERFGISRGSLAALARLHNWPRRKHKSALPPMTREQRLLYRKFLRSNMPRAVAIFEACR